MLVTKKEIIKHIKDSRMGYWEEMTIEEKRSDYKNQYDLLKSIGGNLKTNIEVQFIKDNELK